jgi:hypothetical protein
VTFGHKPVLIPGIIRNHKSAICRYAENNDVAYGFILIL